MHPISQISFDTSNQAYVIEASAGTGKTWTIERLYIKVLLEASQPDNPDLPLGIENILVVTFTNDATDELKSRISEQIQNTIIHLIYFHNNQNKLFELELEIDPFLEYLSQRIQKYDYNKDIRVLNRAVQNFDHASIFTIHGFCNKLLHDYQFDCEVNSNFELVATKSVLISELVDDFIRSHIMTNQVLASSLSYVMMNLQAMFIDNRGNDSDLSEAIAAKLPKDLFLLAKGKYQVKYRFGDIKAGIDLLSRPDLAANTEQMKIAKAEFLVYLTEYLKATYPFIPANSQQVSYDELIQKVADALSNNLQLADKIYATFPIVFVDEFQDTDALQWQIFSSIYHLEDGCRGNVIVVGDPKQAIYKFRGADVDTYLNAKYLIGNELQLRDNFRSHSNIMNFVNQLFALNNQGIINVQDSFFGRGIEYMPVTAAGQPKTVLPVSGELVRSLARCGVNARFYDGEVHLVAINGATKDIRTNRLLMAMTFEILALLQEDPELAGNIAILVTKNREADEIVSYLSRYGIRASELKLGSVYATETAKAMYALLQSLFDLTNRRAFLRALTSILFNLPLVELQLTILDGSTELTKWQQRFFIYKQVWEAQGVISLIYSLLKDIEEDNHYAKADGNMLTRRMIANLWQLGELLNIQSHKVANTSELLFWFKNKLSSAREGVITDMEGNSEELVRLDNDDQQIVITTQHKSKGLEYDILFCPYFKNGVQLDGAYDFNYRRPFFSTFRKDERLQAELVMDPKLGVDIVNNDNKEAHRLNYVALTRAKSRIYIYLKQPTITKSTGKYNINQRPDKLVELFGYVANDPSSTNHALFNYPYFFSETPDLAIKSNANLPGVCVYNRDEVNVSDLIRLSLSNDVSGHGLTTSLGLFDSLRNMLPDYYRQSYTALTKSEKGNESVDTDYFVSELVISGVAHNYRYQVLNDSQLSGARFGVLFHELCEKYPFDEGQLFIILHEHNVANPVYHDEFRKMLDEAFNYCLVGGLTLNMLKNCSQHELEFNLLIGRKACFKDEIAELITSYYGKNHPFSQAIFALDSIESGFLVGFIDLMFEYEGRYWVLDYKTNKLDDYTCSNHCDSGGEIINSMAEHHYYLQYLLYLVAIKRYLEQYLGINDATHLLGGTIYYYVRAVYLEEPQPYSGIYLDNSCQNLVRDLDILLKGLDND